MDRIKRRSIGPFLRTRKTWSVRKFTIFLRKHNAFYAGLNNPLAFEKSSGIESFLTLHFCIHKRGNPTAFYALHLNGPFTNDMKHIKKIMYFTCCQKQEQLLFTTRLSTNRVFQVYSSQGNYLQSDKVD